MLRIADNVRVRIAKSAITGLEGESDKRQGSQIVMKRNLLWRGLLILAVAVVCFFLAYPPQEKINLGLDLQGGMHLVLQVHTEDALRAETDSDMARLIDVGKDKGAPGLKGRRTGDATFVDLRPAPEARDAVSDLASKYLPRWKVKRQGDDLVFTMNDQGRQRGRATAPSTRRCRRSATASTSSASPSR